MTRTEIYKRNADGGYDLVTTFYDTGVIEGTAGGMTTRLREVKRRLEDDFGEDIADHYEGIRDRLRSNWNTLPYRIVWYEDD